MDRWIDTCCSLLFRCQRNIDVSLLQRTLHVNKLEETRYFGYWHFRKTLEAQMFVRDVFAIFWCFLVLSGSLAAQQNVSIRCFGT